jgi:hypothetical protein
MENSIELMNKINSEVGVLVENKLKATDSQIKSLEEKVNALKSYDDTQLKEEVIKLSALVEALKEQEKAVTNYKSLREQLEEAKGKIGTMVANKEGKVIIKTVGDMSIANNVTGAIPQAQRIAGMNAVPSRQVRFLDVLTRATATSNLIEWVYQSGKEGTAGETAEGTLKNQIDFNLLVGSQKVEKTTAYIRVTDEMLNDIDFITSEINNELMRELMKAVELGAYSGDGTTPSLNGVRTVATAFAAGTFANAVDSANEVDVLVVAMNQIMIAEQGMPNAIFMHPSDVTKLKMVKVSSSDRRYVERLAMVAGELSLDGVRIIPTTLVTAGQYLVGDFTRAYLYEKEAPSIEIGYNGDDFKYNFKTIRVEWRGAVLVKNNDRTAFVKGVFATDKAALETT